jgi:hypothetical protein
MPLSFHVSVAIFICHLKFLLPYASDLVLVVHVLFAYLPPHVSYVLFSLVNSLANDEY